jgi:hypothetical protein
VVKNNESTVFAVFFAAFAAVIISGLSLLTPTVIYGQPSERDNTGRVCPYGGELQGGRCVDEPSVTCPQEHVAVGSESDYQCGKLIAQERPVCPEGSTDTDEREYVIICIDDTSGEEVTPICTSEDTILEDLGFPGDENLFCDTYEFTDERRTYCNEGYTMTEEGQCVSRPGQRIDLPPER